jgi:pyroglutamyl-peptidase
VSEPRRVLVTGFLPFGGARYNPSGAAARRVDGLRLVVGDVEAAVVGLGEVPVVWHDDRDPLDPATGAGWVARAIERIRPALVLCLGVGRAGPFRIERRARNVCSAPGRSDERGTERDPGAPPSSVAHYRPYHHVDGPLDLASTLPWEPIAAALVAAGIACEPSDDAGRFVCEDLFFDVLWRARETGAYRAGFLHVPPAPGPGPDQDLVDRAVRVALEASLDLA